MIGSESHALQASSARPTRRRPRWLDALVDTGGLMCGDSVGPFCSRPNRLGRLGSSAYRSDSFGVSAYSLPFRSSAPARVVCLLFVCVKRPTLNHGFLGYQVPVHVTQVYSSIKSCLNKLIKHRTVWYSYDTHDRYTYKLQH